MRFIFMDHTNALNTKSMLLGNLHNICILEKPTNLSVYLMRDGSENLNGQTEVEIGGNIQHKSSKENEKSS